VRKDAQGDRRIGVASKYLNRSDVRSGADGDVDRRVAQVVDSGEWFIDLRFPQGREPHRDRNVERRSTPLPGR
jgi:hypothetical protein